MHVVRCPNCQAELDLDAEDIGHRVECPGCMATFTAVPPDPAPTTTETEPPTEPQAEPPAETPPPLPPPSPPRSPVVSGTLPTASRATRSPDGPITLNCPACLGKISVMSDDIGHKVECPMCGEAFQVEDPARQVRDDPLPPSRRRSRRRYDDDDEEYDRPRRRYRERDEGNPYESENPKAWVWAAKRELATPGGGLEVLGYLDLVFGVLSILIGVLFAFGLFNGGGGGPGIELVWMNVGPGISGVVLGALKAIGGRSMRQVRHRSLAIFAGIAGCVPLNVACCLGALMGPAYICSIVFGIMALTHLFKRGVRKAFEINRPDGDVDAV